MITKANFQGNPNIGLMAFATEKYVVASEKYSELGVLSKNFAPTRVAGTELVGIFLAGNSNGVLVPNIMYKHELEGLRKELKKTEVCVINTKHTALGNLILCNDYGCIVSEKIREYAKEIGKCLDVDVKVGTIEGVNIVGSMCVATNKGFLLNMHASKRDFNLVKKDLKVEGDIGTINFGSPFIKAGLLANSKGAIIGKLTTGPEVIRVQEALNLE